MGHALLISTHRDGLDQFCLKFWLGEPFLTLNVSCSPMFSPAPGWMNRRCTWDNSELADRSQPPPRFFSRRTNIHPTIPSLWISSCLLIFRTKSAVCFVTNMRGHDFPFFNSTFVSLSECRMWIPSSCGRASCLMLSLIRIFSALQQPTIPSPDTVLYVAHPRRPKWPKF